MFKPTAASSKASGRSGGDDDDEPRTPRQQRFVLRLRECRPMISSIASSERHDDIEDAVPMRAAPRPVLICFCFVVWTGIDDVALCALREQKSKAGGATTATPTRKAATAPDEDDELIDLLGLRCVFVLCSFELISN